MKPLGSSTGLHAGYILLKGNDYEFQGPSYLEGCGSAIVWYIFCNASLPHQVLHLPTSAEVYNVRRPTFRNNESLILGDFNVPHTDRTSHSETEGVVHRMPEFLQDN